MSSKQLKKVLFVTHQLSYTGAPMVLLDFMREMRDYCQEMEMVSLLEGPLRDEIEKEFGISIQIRGRFFNEAEEVREWASQYDLVVCNTLLCYELIHVLNGTDIPVLWWVHEGKHFFEYFKTVLPDPQKFSPNIHIYAVSPTVASEFHTRYGVSIATLPFCVPDYVQSIEREDPWEVYDEGHKAVRFLTVGVLGNVKGQDFLAETLRKMSPSIREKIQVLFVGNEEEADENIKKAVHSVSDTYPNVNHLNQIPREELMAYVEHADYLLIPSRVEPMPTIAVEGMSLGTPSLISNVCGVTEFCQDGVNSLIFKSEDRNDLEKGIRRAIDINRNDSQYESLSKEARKVYDENFHTKCFSKNVQITLASVTRGQVPAWTRESEKTYGLSSISEKRKKIWEIELNLLREFDAFCKKHELQYFIDYGTLLGAVRHGGFIPWDDDIDVTMLRKDYERMQLLAQEEFTGDIFFQSSFTDAHIMQVSKLRDRRTTAIEHLDADPNFCQGIFIDIFPLDAAVDGVNFTDQMKEIERECLLSAIDPAFLLEQIKNGRETVMPFDMISELIRSGPKQAMRQFELYALDHAENSKCINWVSNELRGGAVRRQRDWYREVVYLPFEDMMLPAPVDYEKVLAKQYGFFLHGAKYAPHEITFFDTERPSSYYMVEGHKDEVKFESNF